MKRAVVVPLVIGIAAAVVTLVYAAADPRRALVAWVASFGFGLATVVAALVLVMVLYVTGAQWWRPLRLAFVGTFGPTPLFVLLFFPIAGSLHAYPWMTPPAHASGHLLAALEHQRTWNNPIFFLVRAALYLAIFTTFAILLRTAPSGDGARRETRVSAAGLPALAFALTFASFDWLMSLEPGWVSTIYGIYVFTSGLVSALGVIAIVAWLAERRGLLPAGVAPDHFHALGRLMLMAVILWAYIAFFQLLLVWIANIPREASFYVARSGAPWTPVNAVLVLGRFFVPFFALLSRPLKRSPRLLAAVGGWLVAASALDFAWLVIPSAASPLSFADLAPFVCVFALAWAYGARLVLRLGMVQSDALPTSTALERALTYRSS